MLKTYELMSRHFGWRRLPRAATERQTLNYLLDRALRAQGIVSLESVCYLDPARKPAMRRLIDSRVRRDELVPVVFPGGEKQVHWTRPETLDTPTTPAGELVYILSPFDPLVIQRKQAARNLALGLASLTVPLIPLLLLSGLIPQTIFVTALAILLFRGLLRPEVEAYLNEA